MVMGLLELTEMTGPSIGFDKTLPSTSYNFFLMLFLTSMYDPRAPTLAAGEEERKTLCKAKEFYDMREDTKKKE